MLETKILLEQVKKGALSEEMRGMVKNEVLEQLSGIKRKGIKSLTDYLSSSDFFTAPASTKFHGNHEGGLAAHSLLVYREFDFLIERCSEMSGRRELKLTDESRKIIGICHDLCKIGIYKKMPKTKAGKEPAKPYNFADEFPFGHGEKSVLLVSRHIELSEEEALMIRWHMGTYDPNYEMNQDMIKEKCPSLVLLQNADRIVSGAYNI